MHDTMWKLLWFSLTYFWQKYRESNVFTKEKLLKRWFDEIFFLWDETKVFVFTLCAWGTNARASKTAFYATPHFTKENSSKWFVNKTVNFTKIFIHQAVKLFSSLISRNICLPSLPASSHRNCWFHVISLSPSLSMQQAVTRFVGFK